MRDAAAETRRTWHFSWRIAAAIGVIAALVASVAFGARQTIDALLDVHHRYALQDGQARAQAGGTHEGFDAHVWAFLRRSVRRGDTYLIVTPRGKTHGLVDEGFVTRSYANYFLLPAVQTTTRRDANVIISVGTSAPARARCATGGGQHACVLRLHP